MVRIAVVLPTYGPHHIACARSLSAVPGIDPVFIELASQEHFRTLDAGRKDLAGRLSTLMNAPYEQCPPGDLSRLLISKLTDENPDALAIAGYRHAPMQAAAKWARRAGKASVLIFEAMQPDHPRWWRELPKKLFIRRHFRAGFVGGASHRQYLSRLGVPSDRIWDRFDVVDNGHFAAACAELGEDRRQARQTLGLPDRYFLYAGSFSPEKNLPRLLDAYGAYAGRDRNPWSLVLLGDGPQKGSLEGRAARLKTGQVLFPGSQPYDRLPAFYAMAGAFVLPSLVEPWGLEVNEAMACGLPILASNRCGCAADLVQDGRNGLLFSPRELEEMVASMGLMAALGESQRQAMGRVSREIIAAYTPDAWASNLAACVQQIVAGRPQAVPSL